CTLPSATITFKLDIAGDLTCCCHHFHYSVPCPVTVVKKKSLVTGLKRDKKNVFFFFFINFVALGNVEHGKFYRLENLHHPCLGARQILR
ncbi:unnamed protein product, partial [Musa banksii]